VLLVNSRETHWVSSLPLATVRRLPVGVQCLVVPALAASAVLAIAGWNWLQADWGVTRKDSGYHLLGGITFGLGLIAAALVVAIAVQAVRQRAYRWLVIATVVVAASSVVLIAWREPALASICACDGA
jgi:hypothetical protein